MSEYDAYNIGMAFRAIETELIASMIRNFEHHKEWEHDEGFDWTAWQTEQLKALEDYRLTNKNKFAKEFQDINDSIPVLINWARKQGGADEEIKLLKNIGKKLKQESAPKLENAFFRLNDRKMDALINATQKDFKRAEYAVLRRANDEYRRIIFNAQVYANSGAATYEQAVDMATKDFLSRGILCIEYANGSRHTISDYADMAIKTAHKRAYLTGEGEMRAAWGEHLVIVNKRTDACPKCMKFHGKVFIDDVYSGGTREDGDYPLLSSAMAKGLYHPRCRDIHTTYFEGITGKHVPSAAERKHAEQNEIIEQQENYAARQADKFERLAANSLDPGNKQKYEARANDWEKQRRIAERRKAYFERKKQANIPNLDEMPREKLLTWIDENLTTPFEETKGANTDFIKEAAKVIYEFENRIGGSIDGLSVKFGGTGPGVFAKYDDSTKTLLLKKSGSIEAFEQSQHEANIRYHIKWKTDKDYHATETFSGTVWHELGHAIDVETGQELSKILGNDVELFGKATSISAYARTQQGVRVTKASEAWAENFAAYMDGGANKAKVPAEIADMIENYFAKEPIINSKSGFNMSTANSNSIIWGENKTPLTKEQRAFAHAYAEERNIVLQGVKKANIDFDLLIQTIDDADKMLKAFPEIVENEKNLSIIFKKNMLPDDFAFSPLNNTNVIELNAAAFGNRALLEKEYKKLVDEGHFVKGTDYHSIIYHEFGHLIWKARGLDPLEITKEIIGSKSNAVALEYVRNNLSGYAAELMDGTEIIAEIFSAYYSGNSNEFVLQFMKASGII